MRDPKEHLTELEEKNEVLEPYQLVHEHLVPNWVWGDAPDGHNVWQVGTCTVCRVDVTRNGTGASFSRWVAMP